MYGNNSRDERAARKLRGPRKLRAILPFRLPTGEKAGPLQQAHYTREMAALSGSTDVLLVCTQCGGEALEDLVACIGAFAVSDELETGLHRAFEHAELWVAFAKVSLSEGDRQEFEHFVEDMPKMAMIFSMSEKLRH